MGRGLRLRISEWGLDLASRFLALDLCSRRLCCFAVSGLAVGRKDPKILEFEDISGW